VEKGVDKSYYQGFDWQHPREFKSENEKDSDYGFCCCPEHAVWMLCNANAMRFGQSMESHDDELPMETPENELMRCSRCKVALYCSKQCQEDHYPNHKKYCRSLAATRKDKEKIKEIIKKHRTN
jgi:hypothetical protein